jgi:hypothetical protein
VLVLSWAARRTLWGRRLPGAPSSLLAELPAGVIERPAPAKAKSAKISSHQLRLF